MKHLSIFLKLTIFTWLLGLSLLAFGQQVLVPNTNVTILPPQHFELSDQFDGFIHVGTASTILVMEMPNTNWVTVQKGMRETDLGPQGVTIISDEVVTLADGQEAALFVVSFVVNEIDFERIMFFTGDIQNTIRIDVNYPVMFKSQLYDNLIASLLTVKF